MYGNDRKLRGWLEEQCRCYVLAVKNNEPLWADTEGGSAPVAARELAQQIPAEWWQRLSAGDGSKGPRLYDWGWLPIRPWSAPDQGHWLLVRAWSRARASPTQMTWPTTPVLVRERCRWRTWCVWRAPDGSSKTPSWIIEDAFKEAKQEVGLDEYEVRLWVGWRRHITLALLAHAFLAVIRSYAAGGDGKRGICPRENSSH